MARPCQLSSDALAALSARSNSWPTSLVVAVGRALHDLGVRTEGCVVDERPAVHVTEIDARLDSVTKSFQAATRICPIEAQVEREVVASAGADDEKRHVVLSRHLGDESLGAITARHTEEIGIWQGTPGTSTLNVLFPAFAFNKVTRFAMALTDSSRSAFSDDRTISKLDTRPDPVARSEDLARNRRGIAELRSISPAALSDGGRRRLPGGLPGATATAGPSGGSGRAVVAGWLLAVPLLVDRIGDLLVVVYLLLLGTFFLALAGLDPGSAFGGMGASREVTVAALAEPTLAVAIFALARSAGSTNLGEIAARTTADPLSAVSPGHLLAFAALFIVMLAETGRLPVDNPATHLELTMIHEAMVLEYSGRYLALIEWAAALKLLVFFALLGNLFVPWGLARAFTLEAVMTAAGVFAVKVVVLAVAVAVLETRVAKLRLFRVPELLSASFVLALLAVTSSFLLR